jgi:flagellar hook-associated protein 1 FlgK
LGQINLVEGGEAKTLSANDLVGAYGGDLTGGQLYGMIKSRDEFVTGYKKELDSLANTLANGKITITLPAGTIVPEGATMTIDGVDSTFFGSDRTFTKDTEVTVDGINGLHKLGYLLTDPVTAGGTFFTGNTAGTLNLDASIAKDPTLIASSMRTTGIDPDSTVIRGNNTMALIMSELKDTKFAFKPDTPAASDIMATVDDYFRATVSGLGIQSKEAQRQYTNIGMLVEQVDSRRQSVSGVSLDEEMANMIKFQHAYNAAARVMTTFDQMLDKIINGMGTVGR